MASGSGSDTEGFEVAEILDNRGRGRNVEYLVRWDGFEDEEDSWEPAKHLGHAQDLIDKYLASKKSGKTPKKQTSKQLSTAKSTRSASGTTTITKTTSVLREVQTSRAGGKKSFESSYTTSSLGAGTQSESSSPESSPRLSRRIQEKREDIQAVRDRLLGKAKIGTEYRASKFTGQSGILSLNRQDLPIIILVTCLLFIALTFVVEQRK